MIFLSDGAARKPAWGTGYTVKTFRRAILLSFAMVWVMACSRISTAQTPTPQAENASELLKKLDQLVEQNGQLERQNRELMDEIQSLRRVLAEQATAQSGNKKNPEQATAIVGTKEDQQEATPKKKWGAYTPNLGFKVADTEHGDLSISIYTYVRYLNQLALDSTYTNAFGDVLSVVRRQDMQIQKVQFKFLGWVMSPKLRYFLYSWTSNPTQGQGAQVVLAGNLNYQFSKQLTIGGGIYSLPGTRSVEGNFPFWLGVDTRLIADEFFRPSYTSGIQFQGDLTKTLSYRAMLADNLSQLGVSALQLDNGFNTFTGALIWKPSKEDFGVGFGDFEHHDKPAVRLAAHFTRSNETKQSQPNSEAFENTQIRLADGTVIFTPNLFGPGITVNDVRYRMTAADAGLKYRGCSLDGEYFARWLDDFGGPGTAGLPRLFDQGFQLQASAMAVPKTLQFYAGGSTVHGKFGTPYDIRWGVNYFPFKNKVVRWNTEGLYLYQSPVGYTSVPFSLGGTGFVFHTNLEMAF